MDGKDNFDAGFLKLRNFLLCWAKSSGIFFNSLLPEFVLYSNNRNIFFVQKFRSRYGHIRLFPLSINATFFFSRAIDFHTLMKLKYLVKSFSIRRNCHWTSNRSGIWQNDGTMLWTMMVSHWRRVFFAFFWLILA